LLITCLMLLRMLIALLVARSCFLFLLHRHTIHFDNEFDSAFHTSLEFSLFIFYLLQFIIISLDFLSLIKF
jgi:hypothetical protein